MASPEHDVAYYLPANLHQQADFEQVNMFHLVLSGNANRSHNFTNVVSVTLPLLLSILHVNFPRGELSLTQVTYQRDGSLTFYFCLVQICKLCGTSLFAN